MNNAVHNIHKSTNVHRK